MENNQPNRLFVVIHTTSSKFDGFRHAKQQAAIARDHGADGAVLIPDYVKGSVIRAVYEDQLQYLRDLERFDDFLIGANFLRSFDGIEEDIYSLGINILQTDGANIGRLDKAKMVGKELFCGVAFKYSRLENITGDELRAHCSKVEKVCDVPTTSGQATGVSASYSKIKEIRSYLTNGKRLGIASGVNAENIIELIQAGATDFLVATSLIATVNHLRQDMLDSKKVCELAKLIHDN